MNNNKKALASMFSEKKMTSGCWITDFELWIVFGEDKIFYLAKNCEKCTKKSKIIKTSFFLFCFSLLSCEAQITHFSTKSNIKLKKTTFLNTFNHTRTKLHLNKEYKIKVWNKLFRREHNSWREQSCRESHWV